MDRIISVFGWVSLLCGGVAATLPFFVVVFGSIVSVTAIGPSWPLALGAGYLLVVVCGTVLVVGRRTEAVRRHVSRTGAPAGINHGLLYAMLILIAPPLGLLLSAART